MPTAQQCALDLFVRRELTHIGLAHCDADALDLIIR
jgi:hypothetical protein